MYLKKIVVVLLAVFFLAWLTGLFFDHRYQKRWDSIYFSKLDTCFKTATAYDVIFMGDSRVHFGINPYFFDSASRLNAYNMGLGGANTEEINMLAKEYLVQHPAPKYVLLSVDQTTFVNSDNLHYSFHYFFYLDHDTVAAHIKQNGYPVELIKLFPFTKYSFMEEYYRSSIFVSSKTNPVFGHNYYKGFYSIHPGLNNDTLAVSQNNQPVQFNLSRRSRTYYPAYNSILQNTIALFQSKGTMVILVCPPESKRHNDYQSPFKDSINNILSGIADKYKVPYLRMDTAAVFEEKYFADKFHLNYPGTIIYSKVLAQYIHQLPK